MSKTAVLDIVTMGLVLWLGLAVGYGAGRYGVYDRLTWKAQIPWLLPIIGLAVLAQYFRFH
jgi:hypothetical protein